MPFIGPDLATDGVTKSGYVVNLDPGTVATVITVAASTCNAAAAAAIASFHAHAEPSAVNSTGVRSFASDQRGTIYQSATGAAIAAGMASASILN